MPARPLRSTPSDVSPGVSGVASDWLWQDFLRAGRITLLTGQPGLGKSTLLIGLLRHLAGRGRFLGLAVKASQCVILSGELTEWWADHFRRGPLGSHLRHAQMPRAWNGNPEGWVALVDGLIDLRERTPFDLFVVDSMNSTFQSWARDRPEISEILRQLRRLTALGVAVLVLQYPDGTISQEELLSQVDIGIGLRSHGQLAAGSRRRQLVTLKSPAEASERIAYEWDGTAGFMVIDDPETMRFHAAWKTLKSILERCSEPLSAGEIVERWPKSTKRPSASGLQKWLKRATEEKRVARQGSGRRNDPYRYRLEG